MAMLPFCGYHMGDYWQHWLDMGKKITKQPKIFHVNWFRTDEDGKFLWPGFGENLRVLEWIIKRCFDETGAREAAIGYLPEPGDINLEGAGVTPETLESLLTVDKGLWQEDIGEIKKFYEKFGSKLPAELAEELAALEQRFAAQE